MSDVGEVAHAIGSLADVARPLIENALAEKYDKERRENVDDVQDAFVRRDPDALHRVCWRLCNDANHPPTATGDVRMAVEPGVLHALLLCACDAIYGRRALVRLMEARK